VEDVHAEKSASEPEASRDERESFSRLPLVADASTIKAIPVERRAAVNLVDPVDKGTEGSEPGEAGDEVDRVVHEAGGEGKKPYQTEDNGPGRDDFGVDFATKWASVLHMVNVKEMTDYAENDCARNELRKAKDEGKKSGENHAGDWWW